MKETELKPCPFCGGEVRAYFTNYITLNKKMYHLNCNRCNTYFGITENSRYVSTKTTERELIEAWNRRVDNVQRETERS